MSGFTHKHVLSEQNKKHFGVHLGKMKKWKIELESNRGLIFLILGCSGFFRTPLNWTDSSQFGVSFGICGPPFSCQTCVFFAGACLRPCVCHATRAGDRYMSSCGITCICGFLTLEFENSRAYGRIVTGDMRKSVRTRETWTKRTFLQKVNRTWQNVIFRKMQKHHFCDFWKSQIPNFENRVSPFFMCARKKVFTHAQVHVFVFYQFWIFRTVQEKSLLLP